MLDNLKLDIQGGVRNLIKRPGFTVVAVLSLGLGIGANTAIFTIINAVFLHPLPVEEPACLIELFTRDTRTVDVNPNFALTPTSLPNHVDYRDRNTSLAGLCAATNFPLALDWSGNAEPEQINAFMVTANYFDVLGVKPVIGRTFTPDEDKKPGGNPLVVLSYSLWVRRFGADKNVIGRAMTLNRDTYTVIGVGPAGFKGTFSLANPDLIWIPLSMRTRLATGILKEYSESRRMRWLAQVGRLKPGVTPEQATAELKIIASALEKEYPNDNRGRTIESALLSQSALGINNRRQFELAGGVLMSVVGLVLLIACVNLANLLLAQSAQREREMTIRASMGANRWRLMAQLLTESVLLAGLGGLAGLLIAYWGRSLLWSFRPPLLQANAIDLSLDARVLGFTAGVSLLTGLLFGLFPALKASNPNLAEVLKLGGRGNTLGWKSNRLRSLLVVSEIALTLVALCSAGLFLRSMQSAQRFELGFESKKLFVFAFDLGSQQYEDGRGQQFFRTAIERALTVPGVQAATVATNFPMGGGFSGTVFREGELENPNYRGTLCNFNEVTPEYFKTLRIPLRGGRNFTEFDGPNSAPVAILNQKAAQLLWAGEDALHKRFTYFGNKVPFEVVGIVANSVVANVGEDPQPVIYYAMRQRYSPAASLQVRTTGNPEAVIGDVRRAVQSLDPNLALTNFQTIGEILDQGLWAPRMGATLLGVFGLLALALAAIGIYGVMSHSVAQRTVEIGIRMSLGANPLQILRLILGRGMLITLIGAAAGVSIFLTLAPLVSKLLFDVNARDPLTLAGVTILLAVVALVACYIPSRRAMRVDPIIALRWE
jgi:putative ABC transport system permease protein